MDIVETIIKQRASEYGPYVRMCTLAQDLKRIIKHSPSNQDRLIKDHQRESLDLIATKLARLLNGDPGHIDSWRDIAGYAQLVVTEEEKGVPACATVRTSSLNIG